MRKLVLLLVGGGLVALLATIMVVVMTDTSPTQAAGHKTTICHYDGGKVTQNKVHRDHSWSVIVISTSALAMHLENHEGFVGKVGDDDTMEKDEVINGLTALECEGADGTGGRNLNLDPLVAPGPPGQAP